MAAAAARVSGELVRERERGSGEARGEWGAEGLGFIAWGSGELRKGIGAIGGSRILRDPVDLRRGRGVGEGLGKTGRVPRVSERERGARGSGGAGLAWLGWPVGRVGRLAWARRGGEGCGAGWAWGGLAGAPGGFSLFF